eukprot:TRINITY_DN3130_c0_g1_i7.p1 TRINITY_DN3130_c0_g1~~TRINITY_DN3130_c0_g1_i7.p1  ORF type:complete len:120 (+),score=36.33 TRINITY_DN3130_c0_g1_i7:229-588(+)
MTLAGAVQMFGFLIITLSINRRHSVSGLSFHAVLCYSISFLARLSSILFYEGYLPYDSSGDWFYQFVEILSFVFSCITLFYIRVKYRSTYNLSLIHISEPTRRTPISYAVFCLKKKNPR